VDCEPLSDDVALPHLTGIRVAGQSVLVALFRQKIFNPSNIVWFSGHQLEEEDLLVVANHFTALTHLQLKYCAASNHGLIDGNDLKHCAKQLDQVRVLRCGFPPDDDPVSFAKVCFSLPSIRCLQLLEPEYFTADKMKELVCQAPLTLAHFCLVSSMHDSELDDDPEMAWLAASQFQGKTADGEERKLSLFCEDWDIVMDENDDNLPIFDERRPAGNYSLRRYDEKTSRWEAVRFGPTPEQDVRHCLNTHSDPSEELWDVEENVCTRGPIFEEDAWLKVWLKSLKLS
ncbi:hypothetical protein HK405_005203, partial [Cladochytrium tenue]